MQEPPFTSILQTMDRYALNEWSDTTLPAEKIFEDSPSIELEVGTLMYPEGHHVARILQLARHGIVFLVGLQDHLVEYIEELRNYHHLEASLFFRQNELNGHAEENVPVTNEHLGLKHEQHNTDCDDGLMIPA